MGLTHPLSGEKRNAVIADAKAGMTARPISEKHELHITTVYRIIKSLDLPKRKTGPKGKFSSEEKDTIVADYASMSVCMLMEKYKVAWETIRRVLVERGTKIRSKAGEIIRRNTKLFPKDHPEVIRKYVEEDLDSTDLAPEYDVTPTVIARIIKKAGVTRSNSDSKRKYKYDETTFDVITNESAYWVGMLMTDGSAVESEGHSPNVSLTLKEEDTAHVDKFRSFLKAEHPVIPVPASGNKKDLPNMYARLAIRSRKLANALAKHGVMPKKVYRTAATPELAGNPHFWRGVIDGDGCLYKNKRPSGFKLTLTGTKELLEQFRGYAESISPRSRATVRKAGDSLAYQFQLTGVHAVRLIHVLYKGAPIFLDRKMAIAMSVIGNPDYDLEKMEKASLLYRPKP